MSDIPTFAADGQLHVHGPTAIELDGCQGNRYWLHQRFEFCDDDEVNDYLSGFPVAIFLPAPHGPQTPVLFALQDIGIPYKWNAGLVKPLLEMGIACVLLETPLAGERSLIRTHAGSAGGEVAALLQKGVRLDAALLARAAECVSRDLELTLHEVCCTRHGLSGERVAVLGVGCGAVLAGSAFVRHGFGEELLCVAGHCDVRSIARSYGERAVSGLDSKPADTLAEALRSAYGGTREGWVEAVRLINALSMDARSAAGTAGEGVPEEVDAAAHAALVGSSRAVRVLVGSEDPYVRAEDAQACASMFMDGQCFVVPGMSHDFGAQFWEHVQYFVRTQLAEWAKKKQ